MVEVLAVCLVILAGAFVLKYVLYALGWITGRIIWLIPPLRRKMQAIEARAEAGRIHDCDPGTPCDDQFEGRQDRP